MLPHKFALVSRHIVLPAPAPMQWIEPLNGVVLVAQGLVEDVIDRESVRHIQCDWERIRAEYVVEDLGELCISPGLVDLCVELNGESISQVSKSAVIGGITTFATHQHFQGPKYCDIAPLGVLSDETLDSFSGENGVFGLRTFLVSQDSSNCRLSRVAEGFTAAGRAGLPVFLHPELVCETLLQTTSPFRAMDTAQRQSNKLEKVQEVTAFADESDEEEEEDVADEVTRQMRAPKSVYMHSPESKDQGVMRRTSLKVPTFIKPFDPASDIDPTVKFSDRKRVSLPSIFTGMSLGGKSKQFAALSKAELTKFKKTGVKECIKRGSWMSSSSESMEEPERGVSKEDDFEESNEYLQYLSSHPPESETDAVRSAVLAVEDSARVEVHITAVSSADAVRVLSQVTASLRPRISLSTAIAFLHFSDTDVKPGDTRYKCNPPIRSQENRRKLWEELKNGGIDCITAYHQPHTPGAKFLGSFKKAKSGIATLGLTLPTVWTELQPSNLCQIAYWLSQRPAEILGLQRWKGSLAPGKHADFIVWDPNASGKVDGAQFPYPDMCPMKGVDMRGVVYRTYLRGNLVFSAENCVPLGETLNPKEFK